MSKYNQLIQSWFTQESALATLPTTALTESIAAAAAPVANPAAATLDVFSRAPGLGKTT